MVAASKTRPEKAVTAWCSSVECLVAEKKQGQDRSGRDRGKDTAARVLLWSRDDDEGHGGSAVVGGTIRREREQQRGLAGGREEVAGQDEAGMNGEK